MEWLRADLAAWNKLAEDNPQERVAVQRTLRHWKVDRDLAGIRDTEELAKLPPEEQEACGKLWAKVDELLQRVDRPK